MGDNGYNRYLPPREPGADQASSALHHHLFAHETIRGAASGNP